MRNNPHPQDHTKPVAYDANGNPLYAAPQPRPQPQTSQSAPQPARSSHVTAAPESHAGHNFDPRIRAQYANEPDVVHATRPYEPEKMTVSPELEQKHHDSVKRYPTLNLSKGEYVLLSIKRHPIGLLMPMIATIVIIILLVGALIGYPMVVGTDYNGVVPGMALVGMICLLLIVMAGIVGYIAVWVYLRNTFYLTNESVIQEIQHGIFSKHEQTVSLGSIEDASFIQHGILPTMLNYGEIRLSTEGEETTYRFKYVENPKAQVAHLNNAVESFKNGRPVSDLHDT